jgi:hypothetical protein
MAPDSIIQQQMVISITKLAEQIGCDRTLLTKRFPLECNIIIENNKNFISLKKNQRLKLKYQALDEIFFSTLKKGLFPSVRQLEKTLGSSSLQEKYLRDRLELLKRLFIK